MKYNSFKQSLKELLKEYYLDLIEKDEDIYEFGLCTDSDSMTLLVYYNTYDHIAEELKNYFLTFTAIAKHLKWEMEEWKGEIGEKDERLLKLNNDFSEIDDLDAEQKLELLFDVLNELKEEDFFAEDENFILLLHITDEFIDQRMCEMVLQLNNKSILKDFIHDNKEALIFNPSIFDDLINS